MANPEHLAILKKGVRAWNKWIQHVPVKYLYGTDLRGVNLRGRNLVDADFFRVCLAEADLRGANLSGAILVGTDLSRAILSGANLTKADLLRADLREGELTRANFEMAYICEADLRRADLTGAILVLADLSRARVRGASLHQAQIGWTSFGDTDLSAVKGLETVRHHSPSTVGIDTIYRSKGKIPESFLRGCGVPEGFIIHMRTIDWGAGYASCFISYSSKDQGFADRLHAELQGKGVRCWFAPEDLKIGKELRPTFDEAIRLHDRLLLVLSKHSVKSEWVKREVEQALEEEQRRKKLKRSDQNVLFPIRLDDAVMDVEIGWATDVRRRHIGDFRNWKDHGPFKRAFERLLRDLKPNER